MSHHDDFNFEPVRGLPQVLPQDERMIWQGAPRWQDLALHAFHARKVIWYFAALAGLEAALRLAGGADVAAAARPFTWLMPMGLVAAALLTALAYASARTTVYTLTSKRLVMRVGMAISVSINIPFRLVDGAALKLYPDGAGDIPLKLAGGERIAYLMLWPHARPFHFAQPQPCLRCVPDADKVASLLSGALSGAAPAMVAIQSTAPAKPVGATPVAA